MKKQIGLFIAKSLSFSLIFFVAWIVFFRPVNAYLNERASSQSSCNSQDNDSNALMKKYWEQAAQADELQASYLEQQRRATAALEKQEQLLSRWEKVIQHWEKSVSQK